MFKDHGWSLFNFGFILDHVNAQNLITVIMDVLWICGIYKCVCGSGRIFIQFQFFCWCCLRIKWKNKYIKMIKDKFNDICYKIMNLYPISSVVFMKMDSHYMLGMCKQKSSIYDSWGDVSHSMYLQWFNNSFSSQKNTDEEEEVQ